MKIKEFVSNIVKIIRNTKNVLRSCKVIHFDDPYYQEMFDEKAGKYLELYDNPDEADRRAYNEVVKFKEEEL